MLHRRLWVQQPLWDLLGREAQQPPLPPGLGSAVFASLPLATLSAMLEEVVRMHEAELVVKEGVVRGFGLLTNDGTATAGGDGTRGRGHTASASASVAATGQPPWREGGRQIDEGKRGNGSGGGDMEGRQKRLMQVYISAWMLSPEVDDGMVAAHLGTLAEEMRGF
jgi:hypothetical protein